MEVVIVVGVEGSGMGQDCLRIDIGTS